MLMEPRLEIESPELVFMFHHETCSRHSCVAPLLEFFIHDCAHSLHIYFSVSNSWNSSMFCWRIAFPKCKLHNDYSHSVCIARTGLKAVSLWTAWFCDLPGRCQAAINPQRETRSAVLWKAAMTTSLVWSDFSIGIPWHLNTSHCQTLLLNFPLGITMYKHKQIPGHMHRRFWVGGRLS